MRTLAHRPQETDTDFYTNTLAPVGHRHDRRFGTLDMLAVCVLFVEFAIVARLFIAN